VERDPAPDAYSDCAYFCFLALVFGPNTDSTWRPPRLDVKALQRGNYPTFDGMNETPHVAPALADIEHDIPDALPWPVVGIATAPARSINRKLRVEQFGGVSADPCRVEWRVFNQPDSLARIARCNSRCARLHPRTRLGIGHGRIGEDPVDIISHGHLYALHRLPSAGQSTRGASRPMIFSYDRVWTDIVAMVRSNWVLLLTLVGVFIFLPALSLWLLLPVPQGAGSGEEAIKVFLSYYQRNLWAFVLVNAIAALGQIVILVLLIDRNRPTVAEAISGGARLFPGYFLASLVANFAILFGLLLFIVPGIYILGRFVVLGPVMADLRLGNSWAGLQESWRQTRGIGWRIVGLMLLVLLVGWIATSAATSVLTVVGRVLLPASLNLITVALANALGGAVLGLLLILLAAGIYRQITSIKGT